MRLLRFAALCPLAAAFACGSTSRAPAPAYELATEGGGGAAAGGAGGANGLGGRAGAAACGPLPADPIGGSPSPSSLTVVSTSSATTSEHEPHLARAESGAVAVVWIDYATNAASGIGYAISPDGATWPAPQELVSPTGNRSADPSIAADACGGFHVAWLGYLQPGSSAPTATQVYVASAPAGASSFGPATLVSGPTTDGADKPWITITPRGALLVCWGSNGGVTCARSEDGASWSRATVVPEGGDIELPVSCASPDDPRVYVAYVTLAGPRLSWSDDDGATWPANASRAISAPSEANVGVLEPPSCVVSAGELVVAYGVSTDPMPVSTSPRLSAIRLARSTDHGASFSSYGAVTSAGRFFLHPMLARGGDGALHLVTYEGVAEGDPGALSYAKAAAGTVAFGPLTPLAPLTFVTNRSGPAWPGDYAGLVTHGGAIWAAYAGSPGAGAGHVGVYRGTPP